MRNKLLYGDNLELLRNQKFVAEGTIDLCYIDPPFNSQRRYNQIYNNEGYEDEAQAQAFVDIHSWNEHAIQCYDEIRTNEGSRYTAQTIDLINGLHNVLGKGSLFAYIVSMTARIVEIHRLLRPTGTFFLHCDPNASHYLKVICDAVFLPVGGDFLNEIIWKRVHTVKGNFGQGSKFFGPNTDTILFYSKSDKYTFRQVFADYKKDYLKKFYRFKEPDGRIYRLISMIGPGGAAKGNPRYEFLGVTKYWRYSQQKMEELYEMNMIVQTKPGRVPQRKLYLDKGNGVAIQSLWDDIQALSWSAAERIGYPTQKPVALLERIIEATTNEGDLVLDAYCGCGTTIVAAQRKNRYWIGMDITAQAISTIYNRLEEEFPDLDLNNIQDGGAPRDIAAARLLAHKRDDRLRKEFEKWAILTYCNHKAVIHEKKGGDKGIDGLTYIVTNEGTDKMILQVKSGAVKRDDISKLIGEMGDAELATLITLEEPSRGMKEKAASTPMYKHDLTGQSCHRVRIVTIEEMLSKHKVRLELPQSLEALKAALRAEESKQLNLNLRFMPAPDEIPTAPKKSVVSVEIRSPRKSKRAGTLFDK